MMSGCARLGSAELPGQEKGAVRRIAVQRSEIGQPVDSEGLTQGILQLRLMDQDPAAEYDG